MKLESIEIKPLESKHYSTDIDVVFYDGSFCGVSVFGRGFYPSERELLNGWEPEDGLNHVETGVVYEVAQVIEKALKDHFSG